MKLNKLQKECTTVQNCFVSVPQGPHSQILMTGGSDRGSYIIPQKITTSEFVYPKKSLLLLAYPKKYLSPFFATPQNPSVCFLRPKKIPASFIDPKNYFEPKFHTQKNHSDPPSLKYVNGAPGIRAHLFYVHVSPTGSPISSTASRSK